MKQEFKVISEIIDKNSKVLDVGCGNGDLIKYLQEKTTTNVRGLEISKSSVQNCLSKGLTVIEGNAENDLYQFPKQSFDFVILSQTLQAFLNPEEVLKQLMRVGKKVIITIPNFGYWRIRINLLLKGTMPVTKNLPYAWYNTPNLHMCTIKDFFDFCRERKIKIFKTLSLSNNNLTQITANNLKLKNLTSELGIFLIES